MKFNITIKQQAQAVNGKAKHPLYKPSNDKNFDEDKGVETLNELLQNSSIKIFCNECEKQITLETIVIAHYGLSQDAKNEVQKEKQIQLNKQNKEIKVAKVAKQNRFTRFRKANKQQQEFDIKQSNTQQQSVSRDVKKKSDSFFKSKINKVQKQIVNQGILLKQKPHEAVIKTRNQLNNLRKSSYNKIVEEKHQAEPIQRIKSNKSQKEQQIFQQQSYNKQQEQIINIKHMEKQKNQFNKKQCQEQIFQQSSQSQQKQKQISKQMSKQMEQQIQQQLQKQIYNNKQIYQQQQQQQQQQPSQSQNNQNYKQLQFQQQKQQHNQKQKQEKYNQKQQYNQKQKQQAQLKLQENQQAHRTFKKQKKKRKYQDESDYQQQYQKSQQQQSSSSEQEQYDNEEQQEFNNIKQQQNQQLVCEDIDDLQDLQDLQYISPNEKKNQDQNENQDYNENEDYDENQNQNKNREENDEEAAERQSQQERSGQIEQGEKIKAKQQSYQNNQNNTFTNPKNISAPHLNHQSKQHSMIDENGITRLYCVGCFSSLQQFPKQYSIRKSLKFQPINSEWRVFDEICLLNGLKFWGFGNWDQIKQFMDFNSCLFQPEQIQEHYQQIYLKQQGPKFTISEDNADFDINKTKKPKKKTFGQILHNYYYPPQSEESISPIIQNDDDNKFKRQRTESIDEKRIELIKKISHQKDKSTSSLYPQKRPRIQTSLIKASSFNSNTSLVNEDNLFIEKKNKRGAGKLKNQQEQSQQQDEEGDKGSGNAYNQIQLKPKSSSILPHSGGSGKGLKQHSGSNLPNRSGHKNDGQANSLQPLKGSQSDQLLKGHNIYSYNPKRKQFQIIEYDYYAQTMLAQLQFIDGESQQQIDLKLQIIEEYNKRLDERLKRRQFVIEHKLLDSEFMIMIMRKYGRIDGGKRFQPFRRLIDKNQQYYQLIQTYGKVCRAKQTAEGFNKVKKKLQAKIKNPKLKDFIDYLGSKKQKKQLLGHRSKAENQHQRKILYKQNPKLSKKVVLSMTQNSASYVNTQTKETSQISANFSRMSSRSEQRQRLRNTGSSNNQNNQNSQNNQNNQQKLVPQTPAATVNTPPNSSSLLNLLSQDDINSIQKWVKKQENQNVERQNQFNEGNLGKSPSGIESLGVGSGINIKNFTIKSLVSYSDKDLNRYKCLNRNN